jgi:hypothetical protein
MNRTMMVNETRAARGLPPLTLRDMIVGHPSIDRGKSFYGPMRSGVVRGHFRNAEAMYGRIDRALQGSNVVQGYTDQGSAGDPNYSRGGVGVNINRERFNNWGWPGSAAFRERLQRGYSDANQRAAEHPAAAAKPDPGAGHYSMTGHAVPLQQGGIVTKPTHALLGEHGPEAVIPLKARGFISAIGRTETDFNPREAYSERLNQASNNANVKKLGRAGRDYGFFQMNQTDVAKAIKLGVPPDIAKNLAGGTGPQTLGAQTIAVNEFIKRRWPEQYRDLVEHGNFEGMRSAAQNTWFGLKDHPQKALEAFQKDSRHPRNLLQHAQHAGLIGAPMKHQVEGNAALDIHVHGPAGTQTKMRKMDGMFKQVKINRGHSATPASMEG